MGGVGGVQDTLIFPGSDRGEADTVRGKGASTLWRKFPNY